MVPQGTAGPIKYVETIVLGGYPDDVSDVDVTAWQLCTSDSGKTPECKLFANNEMIVGEFDKDNQTLDNFATEYTPKQYLSAQQTLTSNEWEIALIDGAGKALDYVHFCKDACKKSEYWNIESGGSCGNPLLGGGGDNKIIFARKPDGSGEFVEVPEPTPGSSNDGDAGSVDHYSIGHDQAGVTCLLENITITAHDSSHSAIDADTKTINLSTTSGKGDWLSIVSGGTGLDNGTAGDGSASFTFSSGATSAVLTFAHPVLSGDTEAFGFNVTDGSITETSGSATTLLDDPSIIYSLAGFRFIDSEGIAVIPTQISGKASNIAPEADTFYLQAVRALDDDPSVCVAAFSGPETIQLAAQCDNPSTCVSGQTFNVKSASSPAVDIALNAASPVLPISYSDVNMTFDDEAKAPLVLNYSDAGMMQLHASYTEPMTSAVLTGASNQFVVRPFAFAFSSITASGAAMSLPAGDETGGNGFTSAGSDFVVEVNAYAYQAEDDDVDNNGIPDADSDLTNNVVTPNFIGTVGLTVDSFTPASGSLGALSGETLLLLDAYANRAGADVAATLQYDEVGSINLFTSMDNYLSTADADIQGLPTKIGRFYPDHFVMSGDVVTAACTLYTYMQQSFASVEYKLEARAANNAVTENYDLVDYHNTASVIFHVEDSNDGIDLNDPSRLSFSISNAWINGVIDNTSDNAATDLVFGRRGGATGLEDGPFTLLQLGVSLTGDLDSRDFEISALNMKPDDNNDCTFDGDCTAVSIGDEQVLRYGRLEIKSAHGPETEDLSVPLTTQYWDGVAFVTNIDDSCTLFPLSRISFDGAPISAAVADRTVTVGDGTTVGSINTSGTNTEAVSGDFNLLFTAPGAAAAGSDNTGYFPVSVINLDEWLRYDWDQDGDASDSSVPDAIITFGRARGNDRMIFWQERYQ
jgi:hypothetical protein